MNDNGEPAVIRWMPGSRRCTVCGKVRFATREAAARVIAKATGRHRVTSAYYSSRCGWWHLTSRQECTAALMTAAASGIRGAA